mmetsp:Transcript_17773/g.40119  ORF Transcript_17773/g.40119 Transcript_17773/m.40119 type:complete len:504 (-) Transcript_17773:1038-2549(-)
MAQSDGVTGKGLSSPWLAGANLIDKLLDTNHPCHKVLTEDESNGLANIKKLLFSSHITQNHIPAELTDDPEHGHLAEQFGGVRKKVNFKKAAKSVLNGLKFIKTAQGLASLKARIRQPEEVKGYLPPEWHNLSISRKSYVYRLLSYDVLKAWDYDSLELSVACGENPLLFLGWAIICAPHAQRAMAASLGLEKPDIKDEDVYEFVDEFRMTPESCCNFLRLAENDYNPNPYHNNIHAADVTQTVFSLLQMGADKYSTAPLEIFTLLFAAVCHDQGHPGTNNAFECNTRSDLSIIYNDSSVLENMHSARAFRLLTHQADESNANFLAGMQATQRDAFRVIFTKAIMWTDMSLHFAKLAQLKAILSSAGPDAPVEKFYINIEGRSIPLVLLIVLHIADISNPAKPSPIFVEWCDRLLNEGFAQGDKEKKRALPVSPMCDREATNRNDSQLGFIKYIVRPSFVLLSDLVPRVVDEILPIIQDNLNYWNEQKMADEEAAEVEEKVDS